MTETKALTVPQPATPALLNGENFEKLVRAVKMMFDDTRGAMSEKQALRLAATAMEEPGMGIMEAINGGLHMIEGRPQLSARSLAKKILMFGHDYEIVEHTTEKCVIKGKRGDNGRVRTEKYTMEDAEAAGLVKPSSAWVKHPRNMLFAFCIRNLVTFHFPECRGSALLPGEAEAGMEMEPQVAPKTVKAKEVKEEVVEAEVVDDDEALANEIANAATADAAEDKAAEQSVTDAEMEEIHGKDDDKTSMGAVEKGLLAEVKKMKADKMPTFFENYEKELRGEKEWYDTVRDAFIQKWARFTKHGKLGMYPLVKEQVQDDDKDEAEAKDNWKEEPFYQDIKILLDADNGEPRGFNVTMAYIHNFIIELAESKGKDPSKYAAKIHKDERVTDFYNYMLDTIERADKMSKGQEVD